MKTTEEMMSVNVGQASFYDSISEAEDRRKHTSGYSANKRANLLTRTWAALRARQKQAVLLSGVAESEVAFLQKWLDRKKGGDSLEIGCFRGSKFGMKMIELSSHYTGVELSPKAVDVYKARVKESGMEHKADIIAGDFLKLPTDRKFDLIYAHGVLHHFANPEPVFQKISELLKDDGVLMFTEPSQCNSLFRLVRSLYRPFQSDKEWEWPFTPKTVETLENYLAPVDGFGWGRRSLPMSVLVGAPIIGRVVTPVYVKTVKQEVSAGWDKKVWKNSSIVAVYRKRSHPGVQKNRRG